MAYEYKVALQWSGGKEAILKTAEGEGIHVSTPKEFGGPGGQWTPEDLLVASAASCSMSTFLFFVEKSKITLRAYQCQSSGRMEKTPEGLRFTGIDLQIRVELENPGDAEFVRRLKDKVEKFCPVSASLRCPVQVEIEIEAAA